MGERFAKHTLRLSFPPSRRSPIAVSIHLWIKGRGEPLSMQLSHESSPSFFFLYVLQQNAMFGRRCCKYENKRAQNKKLIFVRPLRY